MIGRLVNPISDVFLFINRRFITVPTPEYHFPFVRMICIKNPIKPTFSEFGVKKSKL